ncbi:MAG: RNase adapter RapZ [Halothiobacillaceae bacterium]|nr:RNase adapter RapZ [Halothiobacillaceae bacterium]
MKLVIVSGLSGSGKTIALHTLEDAGYACVDNLPLSLLTAFVEASLQPSHRANEHAAIGIDIRGGVDELNELHRQLTQLRQNTPGLQIHLLFLYADPSVLLQRFSETRRPHPLTRKGLPLDEALSTEAHLLAHLLAPLREVADIVIDTSHSNLHQLRALLRSRLLDGPPEKISLLLQSFGYKHGTPSDSDFIFDMRCLPNPHWHTHLRPLTGRDPEVAQFLSAQPEAHSMLEQLSALLLNWLPLFEREQRQFLCVSLGCTGGQHRSVFMIERLAERLRSHYPNLVTRHRELI